MMKVSLLWRSAARSLVRTGRAIGRYFGPFPPTEPGAHFTINQGADFRFHASYGRFVFRLHTPAPRTDPLSQADVQDAFAGARIKQSDWPARHPGEMALVANAPRRPRPPPESTQNL
jgi:hypothetical protein